MTYAQVTLAINDDCPGGLEGFVQLSAQLPVEVFDGAIEDGQSMLHAGSFYSLFVDLMDGDDIQIAEKCIGLAQAAELLELAPESLFALGRQKLAQINDEDSEHVRRLAAALERAGCR